MKIIQRLDFEIAACGLAFGTLAAVITARAGAPDALLTGAAWGAGTVAAVYGIRIVGQALPLPSSDELRGAMGAFTTSVSALPRFIPPVPLTSGPVGPAVVDQGDLWRSELRRFLVAARLNGDSFSMRAMIASGLVTDTAYRKLSAPLKSAGVLLPSNAGTDYAPGWNYARAWRAVRDGLVSVPDGRPPRVTL